MGVKGYFTRDNKVRPIIEQSGSTAMSTSDARTKNANEMMSNQIENKRMNAFALQKSKMVGSLAVRGIKGLHSAKKAHDEKKTMRLQEHESMVDIIVGNPETTNSQKFDLLQRYAIKNWKHLPKPLQLQINRNLQRLDNAKATARDVPVMPKNDYEELERQRQPIIPMTSSAPTVDFESSFDEPEPENNTAQVIKDIPNVEDDDTGLSPNTKAELNAMRSKDRWE